MCRHRNFIDEFRFTKRFLDTYEKEVRSPAMARLDWTTFLTSHPRAHLVAAHVLPACDAIGLKRLRHLMNELIDRQSPAADYATAIVRNREVTEIQCGFVERDDADRIASRLGALPVQAGANWASECSLRLDEQVEHAFRASLLSRTRTS